VEPDNVAFTFRDDLAFPLSVFQPDLAEQLVSGSHERQLDVANLVEYATPPIDLDNVSAIQLANELDIHGVHSNFPR
jgi:predicted thioredoxin/glutaredoxin